MKHIICEKHEQHIEAFCVICSIGVSLTCQLADRYKQKVYNLTFEDGEINDEMIYELNEKDQLADDIHKRNKSRKQHFNIKIDHHTRVIDELTRQYASLNCDLQERQDEVNAKLEKSTTLMEKSKKSII